MSAGEDLKYINIYLQELSMEKALCADATLKLNRPLYLLVYFPADGVT
jgi:hypothetical protein